MLSVRVGVVGPSRCCRSESVLWVRVVEGVRRESQVRVSPPERLGPATGTRTSVWDSDRWCTAAAGAQDGRRRHTLAPNGTNRAHGRCGTKRRAHCSTDDSAGGVGEGQAHCVTDDSAGGVGPSSPARGDPPGRHAGGQADVGTTACSWAFAAIASTTSGQRFSGRSWPMSGNISSLAPGIASAVAMPAARLDQRVDEAVDHQRRHGRPGAAPRCGPGCRRWPCVWRRGARRVGGRGRGLGRSARARLGLVEVRTRRPAGTPSTPPAIGSLRLAASALRHLAQQPAASIWPCLRSPVFDMIDVRLSTLSRVLDGDRLGDHPAHRGADDVGRVDAEVVEQAGGVVGHVAKRYGGWPKRGDERGSDQLAQRRRRRVDLGRQADVAVVEADHPEARARRAGRRSSSGQAISWLPRPITSSSGAPPRRAPRTRW